MELLGQGERGKNREYAYHTPIRQAEASRRVADERLARIGNGRSFPKLLDFNR